MTIKPQSFPDWCMKDDTDLPNKFEYSQEKKDYGWSIDEVPPREWENYKNNLTSLWIHYFDEMVNEQKKKLESIVNIPVGVAMPSFPSLGGYKCTAIEQADDQGFVLCNGQTINDSTSPLNSKLIPNLNSGNYLKGGAIDGLNGGNKEHKLSIDHTHNYAHTHLNSMIEIKVNQLSATPLKVQKVLEQKYALQPNRGSEHTTFTVKHVGVYLPTILTSEDSEPPEIKEPMLGIEEHNRKKGIKFRATTNGPGAGDVMCLATGETNSQVYTSGVFGDAVNGTLNSALTAGMSDKNVVNIEPQNVSTVYIMRIK